METLEILWKEVEQILSCSAHDLSHVRRVFRMAERLAGVESMAGRGDADRHILGAAAILHDIARVQEDQDETRTIDHARLGAQMALEILREKGWTELDAQRVAACISTHRYRSGNAPDTLEAMLLYDADKLDCLGAVGIARSFMLAGQYGEAMYIPKEIAAYAQENIREDGRIQGLAKHAPNLEYEVKFRHLPDHLMTESAREIARKRMVLTDAFFQELVNEWEA